MNHILLCKIHGMFSYVAFSLHNQSFVFLSSENSINQYKPRINLADKMIIDSSYSRNVSAQQKETYFFMNMGSANFRNVSCQ